MVDLGGSAGCTRALQRFFEATPLNSGLAYVVVQHVSPSHEGAVPVLIALWTTMWAKAASDDDKLEEGCVYVLGLEGLGNSR